jgi:hypothetical protein
MKKIITLNLALIWILTACNSAATSSTDVPAQADVSEQNMSVVRQVYDSSITGFKN